MTRSMPPLTDTEREAFIAACKSFMVCGPGGGRVPFRHRGRSYRGVDCIGVPVCALQAIGRNVQDLDRYSPRPDGVTLRALIAEHLGPPVPLDSLQPADLVLMRWHDESNGRKMINHVGVITPCPYGGLNLLHSFHSNREVIEHRFAAPWDRRAVEAFRP